MFLHLSPTFRHRPPPIVPTTGYLRNGQKALENHRHKASGECQKLGICDRLFGRAIASHGICWVQTGAGIPWKLDNWAQKILPPNGIVVDSGANIGQMLLYLASVGIEMSHRVLIVSPHFPPINAADCHRVRMSLPYLQEFGWEPTILAVAPEWVEGTYDILLEQTIPRNIEVIRVGALPVKYTRRLGLGNLGLRCLPYILRAGSRILAKEQFDLVYFSTTVFPVMALGALWKSSFGVPYILDLQDPWLSDYYSLPGSPEPPGGKLKYGFSQILARVLEPLTMREVSHVISVSPAYPKTLRDRYSWLRDDQFSILPFGAPEKDFEQLREIDVRQKIFDPNDGKRHWVYVGRGGDDMALALRALFFAIFEQRKRDPETWSEVKLHFIGTSYAPGDLAVKTVEPVAREIGIADLVEEHPQRLPYFEAMRILVDSDAILLIGSNDPGYTASKIYPCILAKKPILAIFHQQSSVVEILHRCNAGRVVTFDSSNNPMDLLKYMTAQLNWLLSAPKKYQPETEWSAFQSYTAREMTRQQCAIFSQYKFCC